MDLVCKRTCVCVDVVKLCLNENKTDQHLRSGGEATPCPCLSVHHNFFYHDFLNSTLQHQGLTRLCVHSLML